MSTRNAPPESRERKTGFPHAVKLLVRRRAGHGNVDLAQCEACGRLLGRHGGQVERRLKDNPDGLPDTVIWGAPNAVLLCGTPLELCCGECEHMEPGMESRGFWIRGAGGSDHDPRSVPVELGGPGPRVGVWLAGDGTYSAEPGRCDGPAATAPLLACSLFRGRLLTIADYAVYGASRIALGGGAQAADDEKGLREVFGAIEAASTDQEALAVLIDGVRGLAGIGP